MTPNSKISRVTRSKQQAMVAYDRLSRWYDWLAASSERSLAELGLKKLKVQAGEKVLEIGFGTGHALSRLAVAVGETGQVVGIDLSSGMFKVASRKLSRQKINPRIALGQGDAAALPLTNAAFDAIFLSFTLELFDTPEIPIVLAECQRVLKLEGRMGVVALARDPYEDWPARLYEWFHQRLPSYVDCRPIYVQSALARAGFQVRDVTRKKMWGLPVEICIAQIDKEAKWV